MRNSHLVGWLAGLCCALVLVAGGALAFAVFREQPAPPAEPTAADAEFFEKDIRPLLIARCYKCHGDLKEPKGQLALTSREAVLTGGESVTPPRSAY